MVEESTFRCGDRIDVMQVFMVNEKLHCTDDIEVPYYSSQVDSNYARDPTVKCEIVDFSTKLANKTIVSDSQSNP